jgi:hypothetical protein
MEEYASASAENSKNAPAKIPQVPPILRIVIPFLSPPRMFPVTTTGPKRSVSLTLFLDSCDYPFFGNWIVHTI